MSIKLMSAAWDLAIPTTKKMVLLCLCDYANDHGICWPSVETMARRCNVSDRTVQRTVKELAQDGFLAIETGGGKGNSNRYFLNPDKLSPLPPKGDIDDAKGDIDDANPDTVSPEPSRTTNEPSEVEAADAAPPTPDEIFEDWNELAAVCGLPTVAKLTDSRRRRLKARINQYPDPDDWRRAFQHIHETPFLKGDNDRGWRADFDFLLQDRSFTKLVEGTYGKAG